ncbi:hypothetical protein VINI7043_04835, partial [Vibrio nigripulchritudo ATCC 27043]
MKNYISRSLCVTGIVLSSLLAPVVSSVANGAEQFVPLPTYRVGPYASSGAPWFAGEIDYF